jgi:hypothetical protein
MTHEPDGEDSELIERYRQAAQRDSGAPSAAAREAILAEGLRIAALSSRSPRARPFETQQRPAPWARWKLAAFGSLAAAVVAGVLLVPRLWPPPPALNVAALKSEPPAAIEAAAPAAKSSGRARPETADRARTMAPRATALTQNATRTPGTSRPQRAAPQVGQSLLADNAAADRSQTAMAGAQAQASPPAPPASEAANAFPSSRAGRPGGAAESTLLTAVTEGDARRAAELLDHGVSTGETDAAGRTPLLLAVLQRRADLVRLLLAHGADPNAGDAGGNTPLNQARREHLADIAALLQSAGAR